MRAAQLDLPPQEDASAELRDQVAARLAAHRARRSRLVPQDQEPRLDPQSSLADPGRDAARSRASAIAAVVAERYANSPSYHSILAEEAERATRQAAAAAEVARRNAEAVANAQQKLLAEIRLAEAQAAQARQDEDRAELAHQAEEARLVQQLADLQAPPAPAPMPRLVPPAAPVPAPELTVLHFEELDLPEESGAIHETNRLQQPFDPDEYHALEAEIAFRQAPVFDDPGPSLPLPANLLEFPRQLVAPRKARPVRALGPLAETEPSASPQLRIFEVEPEQITADPPSPEVQPEWTAIYLDTPIAPRHQTASYLAVDPDAHLDPSLDALNEGLLAEPAAPAYDPFPLLHLRDAASLHRRALALAVDAILIATGCLGAVTTFAAFAPALPHGLPAALAATAAFLTITLVYQVLFFTYNNHTPGMRYASIALCTFDDVNPSADKVRRRMFTAIIAALPLGLGHLWALVDKDHLSWHDRLNRTYLREY